MHRLSESAQSARTPQPVARHGSAGKTISNSPEPRRGDTIQTAGRVDGWWSTFLFGSEMWERKSNREETWVQFGIRPAPGGTRSLASKRPLVGMVYSMSHAQEAKNPPKSGSVE